MSEGTGLGSTLLADNRLRYVYVAGIAFNVIALTVAALAGETLFALTFGAVILYLCLRYWLIVTS